MTKRPTEQMFEEAVTIAVEGLFKRFPGLRQPGADAWYRILIKELSQTNASSGINYFNQMVYIPKEIWNSMQPPSPICEMID